MVNNYTSRNSLVGIVKDFFRKSLLIPIIALPLTFTSCHKPDDAVPPTASLEYFSPTSGNEPLPVHMKLSGTPRSNPISRYKLHIDDKIASSSRIIDTTINFSAGNHSVFGEVLDVDNLIGTTPVTSITSASDPASALLSVSDLNGISLLHTRVKLSGTGGSYPVSRYNLYITSTDYNHFSLPDKVISRSYPIDTILNFYAGYYSVHGEIVNAKNSVVSTPAQAIYVGMDGSFIWNLRNTLPYPVGPVNLFETAKSTPEEIAYDALTIKEARDAVVLAKVNSDITGKINPPLVCNKTTPLFIYNSHNWGKDFYYNDGLIYDGYDGEDQNEIRAKGGTTKYFGTLGIPAYDLEIPDVTHQMNYVLTGDDITDPKSYNLVEAAWPWLATNVQAGQVYVPKKADKVLFYYIYTYETAAHEKEIGRIPVVLMKIVDGQMQLVQYNPNIEIYLTRDAIRHK